MKSNKWFQPFHAIGFVIMISFFAASCNNSGKALSREDSLRIAELMAEKINKKTTSDDNISNLTSLKFAVPPSDEFPGGRTIDTIEARIMIRRFQSAYEAGRSPMQNNRGENLHGFFISRRAFDALEDDASINGIMAYFAQPNYSNAKQVSLVFVPTRMNISTGVGRDQPQLGMWEEIDPCPKMCGEYGR